MGTGELLGKLDINAVGVGKVKRHAVHIICFAVETESSADYRWSMALKHISFFASFSGIFGMKTWNRGT